MHRRGRRSTHLSGAMAAVVTRGVYAVGQLLYLSIMAGLLEPTDFGILAIATAVTALATTLTDFGFATTALQARRLNSHTASALFWANLGLAVGFAVLIILFRAQIAALFGEDEIAMATLILALILPVTASAAMLRSILARRQLWSVVYPGFLICQVSAQVLGVLYAAQVRADHTALLVMPVVVALSSAVLFAWTARWVPRWRPDFRGTAALLRQGGAFSSTGLSSYINRQSDNLLIGYTFSAADVGYYTRAYSLSTIPGTFLVNPLGTVVLSSLRRHGDTTAGFRRMHAIFSAPLLLASALLSVLFFGFADVIVALIYGPGWEPVVPILAVLGLSIYSVTATQTLNWALISQGQAKTLAISSLVASLLRLIGFALAVMHSVLAVAVVWVVSSWLFAGVLAVIAGRIGALPVAASLALVRPSLMVIALGLILGWVIDLLAGGLSAVALGLVGLTLLGLAAALADRTIRTSVPELRRRLAVSRAERRAK